MMSWFLDSLRSILRWKDEEGPSIGTDLNKYEDHRIQYYGSSSRIISPSTGSSSRKQQNFEQKLGEGITKQKEKLDEGTAKGKVFPSTLQQDDKYQKDVFIKGSTSSVSKLDTSQILKKSHEFCCQKPSNLIPFTKSASPGSSMLVTKPVQCSILEKSNVSQKQKDLPSTAATNSTFQTDVRTKEINQTIDKGEPSSELPLHSVRPTLSPATSSRASNEGKTSYIRVQKQKHLPSTVATNSTFQTEVRIKEINQTIENKLLQGESSSKRAPCSVIPILSPTTSSPVSNEGKPSYIWVEKRKYLPSTVATSNTFQTEVRIKEINQIIESESPQDESSSKLPPRFSIRPTLSPAPSNSISSEGKASYKWVEKDVTPTYVCPDDVKSLIEKDIVPEVLKKPLSMLTYKEYFQALLYSEDIYVEKWKDFQMENVTLKLHKAQIYGEKDIIPGLEKGTKKVDKTFIAFELDKIPERRPFLLSRDFVTVVSLKENSEYQGVIYRVVRSNLVLAEFDEAFHYQHDPSSLYNVRFSFNRVCLKRAHQAIVAVSHNLFRDFLFPNHMADRILYNLEPYGERRVGREESALKQILSLRAPPPYLVEGPVSVSRSKTDTLPETGVLIVDAIVRICQTLTSKVLFCAPTNNTCDVFMRALKKKIPESDMFRANAAFRELDEVPEDILPSCLYKEKKECFSCPSLIELLKFKVILSTYMSSLRLYNEGIAAGHFSYIFLVDASSVIEPEALVPLAHFTNERTAVVITGAQGNQSRWIRSNIARQNGLKVSYFERLRQSQLYQDL